MAPQAFCNRQAPRRSTDVGQPQTTFLKTKMCTFHQLGACSRGSSCRYAHSDEDLNPDSFYRTRFCKSIIRFGKCDTIGCTYAHTKNELREPTGNEAEIGNGVEEQNFVQVSRMIEQLPFAQREQLLKYQVCLLPISQRAHMLTWLLQQFPEQAPSPQQGKSEVQECLEQCSMSHPRPRLVSAAYSCVTQEQHVPAREPVWLDMSRCAAKPSFEADAARINDTAACPPPTTVSAADEILARPEDIRVELLDAGLEIKNTFVCEVPKKRPELKRMGQTIGCLPHAELSSEQCRAIKENMQLCSLDVCHERDDNN